jgi:hypothetical protein
VSVSDPSRATPARGGRRAGLALIVIVLALIAFAFARGFAVGSSQQYVHSTIQLRPAKTGASRRRDADVAWRDFFSRVEKDAETRRLLERCCGETGIEIALVSSAAGVSGAFLPPARGDVAIRFTDHGSPRFSASTITKYARLGRPAPRAIDPAAAFAIALDDWLLRNETGWRVELPDAPRDPEDPEAERAELERAIEAAIRAR